MKQVYKIDNEGFFIEAVIVEDNCSKDNYITISPVGFYKAKWDKTKWIEGATEEEIKKINYMPAPQPTRDEILRAQLIKDVMSVQLQLSQQQKINASLLTQIAKLGGAQ